MAQKSKTINKKASAKKAPAKKTQVIKQVPVNLPTESQLLDTLKSPANTKWFLIAAGVVALAAAAFVTKSLFVAALVNGQPIFRLPIVRQLEKEFGSQVLDTMITETLINKEAKNQNLTVSDEEVDAQMAAIENQLKESGQDLDQLLAARNLTREKLRQDIRIQQLLEKMVGADVTATEEEIAAYLSENAEFLPKDQPEAELKEQVRQQIVNQKKSQLIQTWLQELRQNADIKYLVNY